MPRLVSTICSYLPSNRLEKLKGDRAAQLSIAINMQWRICFVWEAGNAYKSEYVLDVERDRLGNRLEAEVIWFQQPSSKKLLSHEHLPPSGMRRSK